MALTRRSLLGTSLALGATPLFGQATWAAPAKVGFIYVGPTTDNGYTYRHDVGRKDLAAALGDQIETSFVESVPEGPDCERVLRQLATGGHQLIFATSFGFMESVIRVARQFPNVKFEHATGFKTAPNVAIYNARFYEGRAVCGTMAAMLTKTGQIGYIGSFPIPEVVMGVNAFTLAAQKIRPDIRVKLVWVNSWNDPGKEADAAKALFDQGCDIMAQHTDSAAPMQQAEQRGLMAFGQAADQSAFGPNAQLTSIVDNWGPYYIERTRALLDGSWKSTDIWHGLTEKMVVMAPYGPKVTPEVVAAADKVQQGIMNGTLHPFTGPITDQKGTQQVAAGATATDEQMLKMNWWVPGVEGQLS
jgi:simple sugar transport system substrate-binding protein